MLPASSFLVTAFMLLTAITFLATIVVLGLGLRSRRATLTVAVVLAVWLAFTYVAASRGLVRFQPLPPTFFFFLAVALALSVGFAVSRLGGRLAAAAPLTVLVALQAFRLPLELLMHRAYEEGVMPVQMSYSGRNFDIVTGSSAIVVAIVI
jgi:hypothetical protein